MNETTDFGYRKVALDDKQALVDDVFHSVARRYDLMNDLMSAGMHRVWKDAAVSWLSPPKKSAPVKTAKARAPWSLVDVAGGTGDIAMRVAGRTAGSAAITVADINGSMLEVGRARAEERGLTGLRFVEANAEALPFQAGAFNAYTIAFGIRNVPRIQVALEEAWRVLKYGGRFICLEFSQVDVPMLDRVYEVYSFNAIPVLGQVFANDPGSYQYLVESIRGFPNQDRFAAMIGQAGFSRVSYRNLSGGVAAIHSGWKI